MQVCGLWEDAGVAGGEHAHTRGERANSTQKKALGGKPNTFFHAAHHICNVEVYMCVCVTWFLHVVALVQHQTVHTFKLPVLDFSIPQGGDQHSVLGPAEEETEGEEGGQWGVSFKMGFWLFKIKLNLYSL